MRPNELFELMTKLEAEDDPSYPVRFLVVAGCRGLSKTEPERLEMLKDALARGAVPLGFVCLGSEEINGKKHLTSSVRLFPEHENNPFANELVNRWVGIAMRVGSNASDMKIAWRN